MMRCDVSALRVWARERPSSGQFGPWHSEVAETRLTNEKEWNGECFTNCGKLTEKFDGCVSCSLVVPSFAYVVSVVVSNHSPDHHLEPTLVSSWKQETRLDMCAIIVSDEREKRVILPKMLA